MKLKWTKKRPTKEGWFFWKRSVNVKDPWKWNSYYIMEEDNKRIILTDAEGNLLKFTLWEAGTEVYFPKGGHWAKINIGKED